MNNMAKSHRITADTIWVGITFPNLMHCLDKPLYPEMAVICKEIYQNLAAILTPFSASYARYLGIMMPEALYVQRFNDPFHHQINPSKYPDDTLANASA